MVVTPFVMQWSPHLGGGLKRCSVFADGCRRARWYVEQLEGTQVRIKDHVIIVGYGLNGRNLARVLGETEIPHVALDLDGETVRREARHGVPIYYGDGSNANVLRHMKIEDAKVLVVALSDPFHGSKNGESRKGVECEIAHCGADAILAGVEELHQLGADDVVRRNSETSIEILRWCYGPIACPRNSWRARPSRSGGKGTPCLRRSEMPELAHHLRGGTLTDVEVETCRIDDEAPAVGKSLAELSIRPRTGASVIAWTRSQVTQSNPSEHVRLQASDVITLLGSRADSSGPWRC